MREDNACEMGSAHDMVSCRFQVDSRGPTQDLFWKEYVLGLAYIKMNWSQLGYIRE